MQDNSICARCGAYSGDKAGHPIVGQIPLCTNCAPQVPNWPYPAWLKAALVALLLLLVVALVNGRKYFHAGRTMYVGERLVQEGHYAQALPYLQETLRIAPESDKAVLLAAKAALLSGDFDAADKAIQGHNAGHFDDANDRDFREMRAIWDRATGAMEKANQAGKLAQQDGHAAEAARLMHQAAAIYPESRDLAITAEAFDESTAFEARDYDGFLAIAEKRWKEYPGSETAGVVASALACKYAVTGNPAFKQQSEEMLEASRKAAGADPESQKSFQEYAERIRYRLDTRQIISKSEYDRRFRGGQDTSK